MHPDLSPHLHTVECNILIEKLKNCHTSNKFARFVGICNDFDRDVNACLKQERQNRQNENMKKSIERKKLVHERIQQKQDADKEKFAKSQSN